MCYTQMSGEEGQAYSRGTQGALHTCQGRREMLKVEGLEALYTNVRGGGRGLE